MVVCSIAYVKSYIHSEKLTDADIQDIIDNTTDDVLNICGVTDAAIPNITMAIRYTVLANVSRKLKTTGELAPSISTPEWKQTNSVDDDIEYYQAMADELTQPYKALKNLAFASSYTNHTFVLDFSGNCHGG